MVTYERLPASWKLNKIKRRGEFSPLLHSRFSRRSCSLTEPCTQSRPGSRSKVLHTQLGNRAFVQTFGTQDSVQKQEMPSPCLSHGWGRRPWRILINLLTPEKQTASHAGHSASYLCCSLLGNKEGRVNGKHFFLIQVRKNIRVKFQRRGKYSSSRAICMLNSFLTVCSAWARTAWEKVLYL